MTVDTLPISPERSGCPIATTLDIAGDKWTLIIVRDMLTGKKRFKEFLQSPEGITTNILADRLGRLVAAGLAEKTLYQEHPARYEYSLTPPGENLISVLQAISKWANTFVPDTWTPPAWFMERQP